MFVSYLDFPNNTHYDYMTEMPYEVQTWDTDREEEMAQLPYLVFPPPDVSKYNGSYRIGIQLIGTIFLLIQITGIGVISELRNNVWVYFLFHHSIKRYICTFVSFRIFDFFSRSKTNNVKYLYLKNNHIKNQRIHHFHSCLIDIFDIVRNKTFSGGRREQWKLFLLV